MSNTSLFDILNNSSNSLVEEQDKNKDNYYDTLSLNVPIIVKELDSLSSKEDSSIEINEYNEKVKQNLSEISSPINIMSESIPEEYSSEILVEETDDKLTIEISVETNIENEEEWYHKYESKTEQHEDDLIVETVDADEIVEEKEEDEDKKKYEEIKEPEFIYDDGNGNKVRYNPETDSMEYIKFDDSIFGDTEFPNCDWNINDRPFFNPQISQYERRKLRTPLTDKSCEVTLHKFIMSLLMTALEREIETEGEYFFYVFKPYKTDNTDEFSSKSINKKIGIRTKLDKESANIILTCYYVLFNNFKKTSDEIIFEDIYREGVLMQDNSFELAKYYDRVATNHPEMIGPLTSIMSECLELKPFADPSLQFDIWKITFSKQCKKVIPKVADEEHEDFLTLEELIAKYNDEWLSLLLAGEFDNTATKVVKKITNAVNSVLNITLTEKLPEEEIVNPLTEKSPEEISLYEQENKPMDITSAPSTPRKKQSNVTGFYLIDSVINRISKSFNGKIKKA